MYGFLSAFGINSEFLTDVFVCTYYFAKRSQQLMPLSMFLLTMLFVFDHFLKSVSIPSYSVRIFFQKIS